MSTALEQIKAAMPVGGAEEMIIDDGFRLEQAATLEWYVAKIPLAYRMHMDGAKQHLIGAFLCGVFQLRAMKFVPKAKRGIHGRGDQGWMNFRDKAFPEIQGRTLRNFVEYAKLVFSKSRNNKEISKMASRCQLRTAKDFQIPTTAEEWEALFAALHEATDGKTVTAFLREARLIRAALPVTKVRGKRRTDAPIEREQQRMLAGLAFKELKGQVGAWHKLKHHHHLDDAELLAVQAGLAALKTEVDALVKARRIGAKS